MAVVADTSGEVPYEDVTDEFRSLCNGWFVAATDGDDDWFEENLAEEFVYLVGGEDVMPKDRTIATNQIVQNRSYIMEDMLAHRYPGGVVIARGTYYARGDIPRGSASREQIEKYAQGGMVRFSTVWVPRDGALRCVVYESAAIITAE